MKFVMFQDTIFDTDDWYDLECRDELTTRMREFLIKHV